MLPKPRSVPFGQLSSLEILQVFVEGILPNGDAVAPKERRMGLERILPMVTQSISKDRRVIDENKEFFKKNPDDEFVRFVTDCEALIKKGNSLLTSLEQ